MNYNNEYAKQTIHSTVLLTTDNRFAASPRAAITEPQNHEFCEMPEKD